MHTGTEKSTPANAHGNREEYAHGNREEYFNANAHGAVNANAAGDREGYSSSNASHMRMVDDQFLACVAAVKGTLVSPRTPSWIDPQTGKGARLDHLVGLGVEVTCASGRAAWVGSPFQDHARVLCSQNWNAENDRH